MAGVVVVGARAGCRTGKAAAVTVLAEVAGGAVVVGGCGGRGDGRGGDGGGRGEEQD